MLAYAYCTHHNLTLPGDFLESCMEQNDWMMMMAHGHLHNLDVELVREMVIVFWGQGSGKRLGRVLLSNLFFICLDEVSSVEVF